LAAEITHHELDVQINASYDTNYIEDIISYKPEIKRMSVMHNFYPKQNTGLDEKYFNQCNKKFNSLNLSIGAFVTSQFAKFGQQKYYGKQVKLPSLEIHRNSSINEQIKYFVNNKYIKEVFVGNYPASKDELIYLSKYALAYKPNQHIDENKIFLSCELNKSISKDEKNVVLFKHHFRRGDLTSNFIRSVQSRKKYINIIPKPVSTFNKGDLVVINKNDGHYVGEL
jgi:hypothetical protein